MKRLCLTCKNKGCIHLCRFQQPGEKAPKMVQIKR